MKMKNSSFVKLPKGLNQKKLGSLSATLVSRLITPKLINGISRMVYDYIQDAKEFDYVEIMNFVRGDIIKRLQEFEMTDDDLFELDMLICENFAVSTVEDMPDED